MIRLRISALTIAAALAAGLGACTDRPPLAKPIPAFPGPYRLDAGDQLRIVVYDQPSLTNLYEIDQSGEVGSPGQYAYVPGITAETAIAVAGGFSERANKRVVRVSRTVNGKLYESRITVTDLIRPGDTVYVPESLF